MKKRKSKPKDIHQYIRKPMKITLTDPLDFQTKELLSHLDPVNHPSYYGGASDPFETIKVAEAKLTSEELIGALKFQIIRYLDRHRQKNGFQDIKKAQWYLNRLVSFIEERGLAASVGPQP